jgi:hypothetical protein
MTMLTKAHHLTLTEASWIRPHLHILLIQHLLSYRLPICAVVSKVVVFHGPKFECIPHLPPGACPIHLILRGLM